MGRLFRCVVVLAVLGAAALGLPAAGLATGCTITWVGDVNGNWFGSSNGGTNTNWSGDTFPGAGDTVCIPNTGAQPVTLDGNVTVTAYTISAGASVVIPANRTLRATADSTNSGTISLTDLNASLYTEDGTAGTTETLTNTSTGTISIPAGGSAGFRFIAGDILNQGAITIGNAEATFQSGAENRNPKLTNTGTLTVASGGAFRMLDSALEQQPGGTVNGPGPVNIGGGTAAVQIAGGSIAANADVRIATNTTLNFTGASADGKIRVVSGDNVVSGAVPSGFTLDINNPASGGQAHAGLGAVADWSNAGTINVIGANSTLRTEDGNANTTETLTNTGTINVPVSGASNLGLRYLAGDIVNQGTITVSDPETSFYTQSDGGRNPKLTNSGTLTIASGGLLQMYDSQLRQQPGGIVNGPGAVQFVGNGPAQLTIAGGTMAANADVRMETAMLVFTGASAAGRVRVAGYYNYVSGNVPTGVTIDVQGSVGHPSALTAKSNWTNAGTINMLGSNNLLSTEDGNSATTETLTNTGTIHYEGTGTPYVAGDLLNQGTIAVDQQGAQFTWYGENRPPLLTNAANGTITVSAGSGLTISPAQPFANAGTVDVAGALAADGYTQSGGTTTLQSAAATITAPVTLSGGTLGGVGTLHGTVINGALISPGSASAPGTLTVSGSYTQQAAGVLSARVRSSSNDLLSVTGQATLAGTLAVDSSGFSPSVGQTYTVLSAAPRSGQFDTVTGAAFGPYDVTYDPTTVKLVATNKPAGLTFSIDSPSVRNPGSNDATLAFTVKLSASTAVGTTVHYSTVNGTAQAPADYVAKSGTLIFGPHETQKTISVTVHGFDAAGPDRYFFVNLSSPTNATIARGQGTGTILNDHLVVDSISPPSGGAGGIATITLRGGGFSGSPTFKLVRAGHPDIIATNVAVTGGARTLTGTLDLRKASTGPYDVVVTLPGAGVSRTVSGGFRVAPLAPPIVDVNIIGGNTAVGDYLDSVLIIYCNQGNVDVKSVKIHVGGFKDGDLTVLGFRNGDLNSLGTGSYKVVTDGPGFAVELLTGNIPPLDCGAAVVFFTPRGAAHSKYHIEAHILRTPDYDPPPGGSSGDIDIEVRRSGDPNLKSGPHGYGRKRYISAATRVPYLVQFENKPTATAPAHEVTITDQLDPRRIDLATASLGPVYFGNRVLNPPPGAQAWTGSVDLRPAKNLIVSITATIDDRTGLVKWHFAGLDPATGLLQTSAQLGFLPPDTKPPNGRGGVSLKLRQKRGLKTGARIANVATIVFDKEAPISTPTYVNTIDSSKPSSRITSIKATGRRNSAKRSRRCGSLKVAWRGTDIGAGIFYYDIYVARNRGKFVRWRSKTSRRSGIFRVPMSGTYRFRSVATDGARNVEKSRITAIKKIKVSC